MYVITVDSWKQGVADPPLGDVVVLPDRVVVVVVVPNVADPEQPGAAKFVAVTTLPDLVNVNACPNTVAEAVVAVLDDRTNEKDVGLVNVPHCPAIGL